MNNKPEQNTDNITAVSAPSTSEASTPSAPTNVSHRLVIVTCSFASVIAAIATATTVICFFHPYQVIAIPGFAASEGGLDRQPYSIKVNTMTGETWRNNGGNWYKLKDN